MSKKVPHAILLSGAQGLGKNHLAQSMAHTAICEELSKTGPCNQCMGCQLFKVGNHTDISVIKADKNTIKIEQIRKLSHDVILTGTRNQYRVVIVENAEKMNKSSANALLKTLEEPPEKVIVLLTTNEIGRLMATIKSRCIKINVIIPKTSEAVTWLIQECSSKEEEIRLSLSLANGSPLLAKNMLDDGTLVHVKNMLNDLEQLSNHQKTVLEISKTWMADELFCHLSFIAAFFLIKLKINKRIYGNHRINSNGYFNQRIIPSSDNTLIFIKEINQFISRNSTALKTELLIEELLISWQNKFTK